MMKAGKRFRPPLIVKVIRECHSSLVPHSRWEVIREYVKERQPEDYEEALRSVESQFRDSIRDLLSKSPDISDNQIARIVGCKRELVDKIRREIKAEE
jgi:hypothetical protein